MIYSRLQTLIAKIDHVMKIKVTENDSSYLNCMHDIFLTLEEIYGSNSDEVNEFNHIELLEEEMHVLESHELWKKDNDKFCKERLEEAKELLQDFLKLNKGEKYYV